MTDYEKDKAQYECPWFTEWFKRMLGKMHLTIDDVARKTGISHNTLQCYRTGVRSPTLKTFIMMLDELGLEIHIFEK